MSQALNFFTVKQIGRIKINLVLKFKVGSVSEKIWKEWYKVLDSGSMLEGCWRIKGTNFPMWISKKRKNPTITYTKLSNHPATFLDTVRYEVKNKSKKIVGIDTHCSNKFIWRGKGILKFLKSKWTILELTETILVIRFERSLLTPAGIDILVRDNAEFSDPKEFILTSLKEGIVTEEELERLIWL